MRGKSTEEVAALSEASTNSRFSVPIATAWSIDVGPG